MVESDHMGVEAGQDQYLKQRLIQLQQEMKEVAMEEATVAYLGELKGETPDEHWTGGISLKKRIESGELTEAEVEQSTKRLNGSFVPVAKHAPKRCVDGSTIEGYEDDDPDKFGRGLGPQIQGGTNGDASGQRLAKGYEEGATLLKDVEAAIAMDSDFTPGDHTDDHAEGEKTGCGQIDGHERRSVVYVDDERFGSLKTILSGLYGKAGLAFPSEKLETLKANGSSLHANAERYYSESNDAILELIQKSNPGMQAIEKLIRPHNEVSLTINFVSGTTFHRDHYNSQTDGKVQNFNLDAWNIVDEHGEDAFFVLADAVATLMDLTDGSLQVFARVPK